MGIVFRQDDGSVAVSEIDPKLGEMTSIIIPGDTEVTVAKNYGVLRIKNVWQLGLNEKLNGKLLSDTVMQNFLFPVHLWSDSDVASIKNTDFLGIIRFIFLPKKTNISFGDRALIGFYAMGLKELSKTEIDLGRSQFLKKIRLSDGEQGYRIVDSTAARLGVYFSDNDLIGQKLNVYLVDATGKNGVGEKVGQIIEVMGGKVVSIDRRTQPEKKGCEISGRNLDIGKKVAKLFGCVLTKDKSDFDLEMRLGTEFANNF